MFRFVGWLIVLVVIGVVVLLGYLGFFPVVSGLLGANVPRDLGVTFTARDLAQANANLGISFSTVPKASSAKESITYSGTRTLDARLSSSEASSLIHSQPWYYSPIHDVYVKFDDNGSMELSGILRSDRLAAYTQLSGFSIGRFQNIIAQIKSLSADPPIYIKGRLEITDNKAILLSVDTLQIGKVTLPYDIVQGALPGIKEFFDKQFANVPNLSITTLRVDSGRLIIKGTAPAAVVVAEQL